MEAGEATTLILGGTGFLGAQLARIWARGGPDASGRCVVAARDPDRLPVFEGSERVQRCAWDATSEGATERLLEELRPTHVILAAALARAGDCERDPGAARVLNTRIPGHVARLARAQQVRLVHISTDLVFGEQAPGPGGFHEAHPTAAVGGYGLSKAAGEELVLAENPSALVVRLPLLFGNSFGRSLGASDALRAALERGERPRLFHDEWRTPLDVANAAEAIWEVLDSDVSGFLHIAGPERLSRLELGELILAAGGTPGALDACTRREAGVASSRARDASLDTRRARSFLTTPLLPPAESLSRG